MAEVMGENSLLTSLRLMAFCGGSPLCFSRCAAWVHASLMSSIHHILIFLQLRASSTTSRQDETHGPGFVLAHVCLRARNNPPLLCGTGLQTAKLSGGHDPGPVLICFCLARANLVLFHGWHAAAAAAVVVVIDGHVIGCPPPLSVFLCHIFEGYGGHTLRECAPVPTQKCQAVLLSHPPSPRLL